MRTLASIQRITALDPIPDADNIEVASVLGWKVVVKRGEFKVGDLAIYMEIDSVPPDLPEYAFLWKFADQRPNNFRIKTIKLRGQISQGILFPLVKQVDAVTGRQLGWELPEPNAWAYGQVGEGDDVTEWLEVTKYEAPLPRGSDDIAGQFFDGVPKTDEERVQSSTGQQHLANIQGLLYYITVKCDGSSMTVAMHDGTPKVASRNYRLADREGSSYYAAARSGGLLDIVADNPHLAIQGELVGPGIQNNRLDLKTHECLVFDVYDRNESRYFRDSEIRLLCLSYPSMKTVPLVETGARFGYSQDDLLGMAEGKYEGTKNEREGIVIRSLSHPRISFKAISNRFLLKGGE